MIGTALAEWLDAEGLVTYEPAGVGGDIFVDTTPSTPDEAVVIFHTGGGPGDFAHPYDGVTVQLMVRGSADPRVSHARAQGLYDAIHGLGHTLLPDGTRLLSAIALQAAPISLGTDENGRHRHVINVDIEIYRPTVLRP